VGYNSDVTLHPPPGSVHCLCPIGQLEGSAHTHETAPATDVAGCLIGQDVTSRREASNLDLISQLGTPGELDQRDVISGEEEESHKAWALSWTCSLP
jgi:hypothetical protein